MRSKDADWTRNPQRFSVCVWSGFYQWYFHLDMILFSRIFYGLKDVPGAAASHLQSSNILTVPALDEKSCADGCRETERLSISWLSSHSQKHLRVCVCVCARLTCDRCVWRFRHREKTHSIIQIHRSSNKISSRQINQINYLELRQSLRKRKTDGERQLF